MDESRGATRRRARIANMNRGGETWRPQRGPASAGRRWVGTIAGTFLGCVLVYASFAKVIDPVAYMELIAQEGLDFLLPAWIVAPIGLALEGGIGLALIVGLRRWWVLLPAAALVGFFVFLTARAYYQFEHGLIDPAVSCGCFGNLVDRSPAEAFWQDLLLMVPPLLLAFVGRPMPDLLPLGRVVVVGVFVAALLGFGAIAQELDLDDIATRLKPGKEVAELCTGQGENRICLDVLLPDLAEGEHIVILASLRDDKFGENVERLSDYTLDMEEKGRRRRRDGGGERRDGEDRGDGGGERRSDGGSERRKKSNGYFEWNTEWKTDDPDLRTKISSAVHSSF